MYVYARIQEGGTKLNWTGASRCFNYIERFANSTFYEQGEKKKEGRKESGSGKQNDDYNK